MNRVFQIGGIALFVCILVLFSVLGVLLPDKQLSMIENRALQQLPDWRSETPERFFQQLTDYTVDQFPARSAWLTAYTQLAVSAGQWLVRGSYLVDGTWIIPKPDAFPQAQFDGLGQALQSFCQRYPDLEVCYALLPYKTLALAENLPAYVDFAPALQNRQALMDSLPSCGNFTLYDTASMLRETVPCEQREALFYRTDFHWNAKGAALCTELLLDSMYQTGTLSADPQALAGKYEVALLEGKRYLGDLNRQMSYLLPMEETLSVIRPNVDTAQWRYFLHPGGSAAAREEIVGAGIQQSDVNYNDLYTENLGYYRVENDQALSGQKVLIFKDSYQNPTIDLFSIQFSQVTVIDPRYYEEPYSVDALIDLERPDLVLFLYHENNASIELADLLEPSAAPG